MEPIPKAGLYYPNKIARLALGALEEVMGKNGLNAILNLANLSHLIDNFPPDNLEQPVRFCRFQQHQWCAGRNVRPARRARVGAARRARRLQ